MVEWLIRKSECNVYIYNSENAGSVLLEYHHQSNQRMRPAGCNQQHLIDPTTTAWKENVGTKMEYSKVSGLYLDDR